MKHTVCLDTWIYSPRHGGVTRKLRKVRLEARTLECAKKAAKAQFPGSRVNECWTKRER